MSVTRKLFLAAAFLAAGYGVARLMGRPAALWYVPSFDGALAASSKSADAADRDPSVAPSTLTSNGARLVPDYAANNPYQLRTDDGDKGPAPELTTANNTTSANAASSASVSTSTSDLEFRPPHPDFEPRVKLRDEAPRPINVEPRSPSLVYAPPVLPTPGEVSSAAPGDRSASADSRATGLHPAGYVDDSTTIATISASYRAPDDVSVKVSSIAPPPWPMRDEENEPRTHIVKDGDSLERLAQLYLDDPNRSNEIYEANRELLASPDLLPIGVELVIPKRGSRSTIEGLPQSSVANDTALRAASHRGMVPIRPIPSASNVTPRAVLLPPIAAE